MRLGSEYASGVVLLYSIYDIRVLASSLKLRLKLSVAAIVTLI